MADFVLRAVGDMLLGPTVVDWEDSRFMQLVQLLQTADLSLGNLESPLTDHGMPIAKIDVARADASLVSDLTKVGIKAVSLANNHIMDYGLSGLQSTRKALQGAGVAFAGAALDEKRAFAPTYLDVKGQRVAFIAFHSYFHPTWTNYPEPFRADTHKPGAAVVQSYSVRVDKNTVKEAPDERTLDLLRRSVRNAKRRAAYVIVSMHSHFGYRCPIEIAEGRRLVAQDLIDHGADFLFGHGPHAPNGIELYKGKFIVHSLGNFFFSIPVGIENLLPDSRPYVGSLYKEEQFWRGFMVEAQFRGGAPTQLRVIPYEIDRVARTQGMPAFGPPSGASEWIRQRLQASSLDLGVEVQPENDGTLTIKPSSRPAADLSAGTIRARS